MDRQALQSLLLAALLLVVVVFAAATLTDTSKPGGGLGLGDHRDDDTGLNGDGGGLVGDGHGGSPGLRQNASGDGDGGLQLFVCVPEMRDPGVLGALVLGLVLLGGVVAYARNWIVGIGAMMIVGWPAVLLYMMVTACGNGLMRDRGLGLGGAGNSTSGASGMGLPGASDAVADPTISTLLLVLAGVLVVAVLVAFALGAGDEEDDDEAVEEGRASRFQMPDLTAVGAAAGEAADRIEETEAVDNEVYRAWREMTTHLHVESPQTATPTEFRDAAVAAGMDAEDVSRLTDLFEEVRYGDAPATDEREREAVAVLRRIEEAYGDGEGDAP